MIFFPWSEVLIFLPNNLQLKDLQVYTVIRVVFQLSEEIPCISAVVVALLADASIYQPISFTTSFHFIWRRMMAMSISLIVMIT